jgi:hypothetical protein
MELQTSKVQPFGPHVLPHSDLIPNSSMGAIIPLFLMPAALTMGT